MADPASVTFAYEPAPDRRTVAVNGPEVIVHLYVEHESLPVVATRQVDAEGNLVSGTEKATTKANVTREIQTTLVLSPEVAIGLGQFLQSQGERARKWHGERQEPH